MMKCGVLLVLLVLAAGCGSSTARSTTTPTTRAEEVTRPVGLDIAAIGVHVEDLDASGGGNDGKIECPRDPQAVAWNVDGISPGEQGQALMIASAQGVFGKLSKLGLNDPIVVTRSDGSKITFKKDPTSATVEANTPKLELTACGGTADVTVYANLVP